MFAEFFLCACAVAAVFSVFGASMAVLIAMPLLFCGAYRLGRACSSSAAARANEAGATPNRRSGLMPVSLSQQS